MKTAIGNKSMKMAINDFKAFFRKDSPWLPSTNKEVLKAEDIINKREAMVYEI